jgi:hypothetical protein
MAGHSTEEIAEDILRYFLRNPQAADNLEGIARWRLLTEAIHRSVEETSRVLEWLVSQGILLKFAPAGSDAVFCLNREKQREAESLLSELLQHEAASGERSKKGGAAKASRSQKSRR